MSRSGDGTCHQSLRPKLLECAYFPLFHKELIMEQTIWSAHDIRQQCSVPGPFSFADMLCQIDDNLLQQAEQLVCGVDKPSLVSHEGFRNIS
ncbi:hypothetical protein AOLI_G00155730 [Acnodon oligacanthus]